MSDQPPASPASEIASAAAKLLAEGDTFQAIEFLATRELALAIDACAVLQRDLYWKKKDVRRSTAIGRAGIQLALVGSRSLEPAAAQKMRASAKAVAYNIGSFNWPGWDEPGITLDSGDVAAGFDAAQLNLRLAIELEKGDLALSRAKWLVGAFELARHDNIRAAERFSEGAGFAKKAGERRDELLNVGYALLAAILESPRDARLRADFEAIKHEIGSQKDGGGDVTQIDTALRVFSPTRGG